MKAESPERISKRLTEFFSGDKTCLFAGAGVGARMGLVSWKELLIKLADELLSRDRTIEAQLVKQRIDDGDYLGAATVFRTCKAIPIGERHRLIASHFQDATIDYSKLERLEPLISLPNSSIVTTNYDRTIFAARCKFVAAPPPIAIEVDDIAMLRGVATAKDFVVVRLHGRAELPSSLILDEHDYGRVHESDDYRDFLYALFRFSSVVFVGFSFADPAIISVLDLYKSQFYPNFPTVHIALLPATSGGAELAAKLSEVNIQTIFFSPENDYRDLWHSIRLCYEARRAQQIQGQLHLRPKPSGVQDLPVSQIHRFLAFVHARATMPSSKLRSLSDAVSDAIVLSIVAEDPSVITQEATILGKLKEYLKLSDAEAEELLSSVLDRLELSGDIAKAKTCVLQIGTKTDEAGICLKEVAKSVLARSSAVYGLKKNEDVPVDKLARCIEDVLLARAWDLSASYAGGALEPHDSDVENVVKQTLQRHFPGVASSVLDGLMLGLCDVLRAPSRQDADLLSKLARAALAVQMALASPRSSLLNHGALPDILYFDASVLMPAIVPGHPMHEGYLSAVKRLRAASKAGGLLVQAKIGYQFLDEIVSHRREARNIVAEGGLNNAASIRKFVSYLGSENVNVFVSGFSAYKIRDQKLTFEQYLSEYAPYETIGDLEKFLESKYFVKSVRMAGMNESLSDYNLIFSDLKDAYEDLARRHFRPRKTKDALLIKHEAEQLVGLTKDVVRGGRPLFVTADKRLQNAIGYSDRIRNLSGRVVSAIGFLGLVDLMVGLKPNSEVVTRLVWGFPRRSSEAMARDYLVTHIVNSMDEKLLVPLPELLPQVLEANAEEISAIQQKSKNGIAAKDVVEFADRLDAEYLKRVQKYVEERRSSF